MVIIADLHIHSKYSRATSKDLTLENLERYGRIKGIDLLGTGDFTHPLWLKELKENLIDDGTGILKSKTGFNFILQTEISLIYSQDNKTHKIHHILLAPSFEVVDQINAHLAKKGRLDYDGRPIFGKCSSYELIEDMKKINNDIEIIPAHCMTPWFSIFGSMSGFDSVEECFKDQAKHIHAVETGMSANPPMLWRLKFLDNITLVSNSDSHSFWPWRIGREANIFDTKLSYKSVIDAVRTRKGFKGTIEVDPGYGKYHFTGHRNCNISLNPKEALKLNDICPVCHTNLTVGVLERIEKLADRPEGFIPKNAVPFKSLIPLSELISKLFGYGISSKRAWLEYNKLIKNFNSEFNVLLNISLDELKKVVDEKLADLIIKNREGKLTVIPGYDGVYGEIKLNTKKQRDLTEF